MSSNTNQSGNKTKRIWILFSLIFFLLIILVVSIFRTIREDRHIPSLTIEKKELAVRGDIISNDNYKLVSSRKLYKASIDTRYLDPLKKDLFIRLFSIYSNIPHDEIKKKVLVGLKKPGYLVLSYNVDSKTAKNLKELSLKLNKLEAFISRKVNGTKILRGLTIEESGEKRTFSYENTLTPLLGYISKYEAENGKTKVKGIKGLEKHYNKYLNETKDGILSGNRDAISYVSFDKNSTIRKRIDGATLNLNIPLKLQKNCEISLDFFKKKFQAEEIIIAIMDNKTGKILTMASSNRFNPEKITKNDIASLNVKAIEFPFEPGSVLKPISISLAMDKNLIKKNETFLAYNSSNMPNKEGLYPRGAYKIGKFTIKDDHEFSKTKLTLEDIVMFSSNIGTLQIAQRLTGPEFYDGLIKFGFTKKTGIDLPYEKVGIMPKIWQFSANDKKKKDNIYKATVSYGQGMTATFIQLMKAYSVFNNNGYAVTPQVVSYLSHNDNKYVLNNKKPEKIISSKTANEMKKLLIKTVDEGTGKAAKIDGLQVGGKTGTANVAKGGGYVKEYVSSFFGFVNDDKNSYTIGVTVVDPISTGNNWYYYYAAQSAVPIFKNIVDNLVQLNYLTPKIDIIQQKNTIKE